jgi:hypothetical protein
MCVSARGAEQPHSDKVQNLLFRLREVRDVLLFKLDGGNNGMVVCDLGIVGNTPDVRLKADTGEQGQDGADSGNDTPRSTFHILGDILAVRPGIGQELFLIKGLHQIKGLLGGKAVVAVCSRWRVVRS